VLDKCFEHQLLPRTRGGFTANLRLLGAGEPGSPQASVPRLSEAQGLHSYGSDAGKVMEMPGAFTELAPGLTEGMVRFAARHESARTVEDMLARRCRLLFLDARLAGALAQPVARILTQETGVDPQAEPFRELTRLYLAMPQQAREAV